MDKSAPVKTKTASEKPKLPCFDDNLACEIRKRKWLEKIWYKDRTNINNYHQFYTQYHRVPNMVSFAKKDFYKTSLNENKHNYKKIFVIYYNLLGRIQDLPLPTCNFNKELANDFNTFFMQKIQKIRTDLDCLKVQQGLTNTPATPPETSDLPDNLAVRQFR